MTTSHSVSFAAPRPWPLQFRLVLEDVALEDSLAARSTPSPLSPLIASPGARQRFADGSAPPGRAAPRSAGTTRRLLMGPSVWADKVGNGGGCGGSGGPGASMSFDSLALPPPRAAKLGCGDGPGGGAGGCGGSGASGAALDPLAGTRASTVADVGAPSAAPAPEAAPRRRHSVGDLRVPALVKLALAHRPGLCAAVTGGDDDDDDDKDDAGGSSSEEEGAPPPPPPAGAGAAAGGGAGFPESYGGVADESYGTQVPSRGRSGWSCLCLWGFMFMCHVVHGRRCHLAGGPGPERPTAALALNSQITLPPRAATRPRALGANLLGALGAGPLGHISVGANLLGALAAGPSGHRSVGANLLGALAAGPLGHRSVGP